ncbi:MAG: MltA domain-containing protein, partial [Alphaproteobacteria bacterium]|nr:MltA domain-containing protein [Alphaproteobacteria bacterium]
DDLADYSMALRHSCHANSTAELRLPHTPSVPMTSFDHQQLCNFAMMEHDPVLFKKALEAHFEAYLILDAEGSSQGLFTGYFEPEIKGSYKRTRHYSVPVYAKPGDLIIKEDLDNGRKRRVIGRLSQGKWQPFWTREQIVSGVIQPKPEILAWVHDPIDLFFLHIQGSGIITYPDGSKQAVGYDGTNGHAYYAIGLELIKMGELAKEAVSMQSIKAWLKKHPDQAHAIMNLNPSYVFLRFVDNPFGPIGSQGVPLTPLRSVAVDRKYYPMGLPLWLDTTDPDGRPFKRLMVAQDTGGAIKGVVRGDVFWGHGEMAYDQAGRMKASGQLYVILPRK